MGDRVRLRQVALVASRLAPVVERVEAELGVSSPFHDPGVGEFGLENAVFAIGDTFLEVVAPVRAGTTAGRYLERRGGDSGYMAIFQVTDLSAARRRLQALGVRVVWTADLADMAATHLHPKDVPGAIVSLDWGTPPGSWRWAGPDWAGQVPEHRPGGIVGLTVAGVKAASLAQRWASVLGVEAEVGPAGQAAIVRINDDQQTLRFVSCQSERSEGISEVTLAMDEPSRRSVETVEIGGVRFVLVPPVSAATKEAER